MENTIGNKQKLFAQYWGQFIGIEFERTESARHDVNYNFINLIDCLGLKPLSSITDEDKIKISLMHLEMISAPYENVLYCFKNTVKPLFEKPDRMQSRITDYLRSKGYALPYMELSIEKQIEYGWIKLIE